MNTRDHKLLYAAVKSMDLEAAELLLKEGVDIYTKNKDGLTLLHILVQKRVKLFDSLHAKKNEELSNAAVRSKSKNAVKKKFDIESDDRQQDFEKDKQESLNAIHKTIDKNERFVKMLLNHKGVGETEDTKLLKFYTACTLNDMSVAESLADSINNINQIVDENFLWCPGFTALHFASLCNVNTVKMLISRGANLLIQDVKVVTSLETCIKLYNVVDMQCIFNLVRPWKDILFSDGKTKLMDYISVLSDPDQHKNFLSQLGKDVGMSVVKDSPLWPNYSILHVAVVLLPESNLQMFEDILINGTQLLYARDSHGSTPIHLAFRQEKMKIVELLLEHQKKAVELLDNDNLSYLHIATAKSRSFAKKLLKKEINVNVAYTGKLLSTIKPGWTPLHIAVHTDNVVIAKALIQKGANLLQTDARGFTALHLLFGSNNDYRMAELLFTSDQLKECVVEGLGLSHLHVAVWKNHRQGIERLLNLGSDIEAIIGKLDDKKFRKFEGCRPLHVAIMSLDKNGMQRKTSDHLDATIILLQRGADIFAKNLNGSSLVSTIVSRGTRLYNDEIVRLLRCNKNLRRSYEEKTGVTLLHLACYERDREIIDELLKENVDVNAKVPDDSKKWPGCTPLHVLIRSNLAPCKSWAGLLRSIVDLSNLLISKGADVTLSDAKGDTPVLEALRFKKDIWNHKSGESLNDMISFIIESKLVSSLLKQQRDFTINPTNKYGMSHFHVACLLNDVEVAQKFLNEIPDIDVNQAIDNNGHYNYLTRKTPLLLAFCPRAKKHYNDESRAQMVNLLMMFDADGHDKTGRTALHLAVDFQNIEALVTLLNCGSDVNVVNSEGKTPLVHASKLPLRSPKEDRYIGRGYRHICNLLVEHIIKMKIVGLQVIKMNRRVARKLLHEKKHKKIKSTERDAILEQLEDAKKIKMCERGFTLRDFLYPTGPVNLYSSLNQADRDSVDSFFEQPTKLDEFPELEIFLEFQYRNAVQRKSLIDSAVTSLRALVGFPLPDVCANVVLKYLTNCDLKHMILASTIEDEVAMIVD